jgi:S1-C subfamily serine protease
LYKVGEAFSLPANLAFQLANSSSIVTRLSVVRIRPLGTPTPTGTVTQTQVPTATGTAAPGAQGYLGIRVVSLNGTLKIVQFLQNSPVSTVLRVNDVITALNDQPLTSLVSSTGGDVDYALITAFFDTIATRRPGETVTLTVQRTTNGNTETLNIPVTLGTNPAS